MGVAILPWIKQPIVLRRLALASVIANVVIVVTGGAVRLTGSGLGCPTWPTCTENSLTPTKAYAAHVLIEFTNRQLTFVLTAIVLATLVSAVLVKREITLAVWLAGSIPAQAVLGGITVLTHLNPWTVAAHFLLSIAIIAIAFALWWRVTHDAVDPASMPLRRTAFALVLLTAGVLAVGTIVTGSGPHAGDKGATHRIHFSPGSVAQLHTDLVMLLIGVTIGFVLLVRVAGGTPALNRAALVLLGVEFAQGLIGFVQYFTHVPAVLVGVHMLGACLVWLAALQVVATTGPIRASS
jgi:heme a synthase